MHSSLRNFNYLCLLQLSPNLKDRYMSGFIAIYHYLKARYMTGEEEEEEEEEPRR
jgi:hypothetical protein